jgi:hypothetical protein
LISTYFIHFLKIYNWIRFFRRAQENSSIAGQTSRELQLIRQEIERRRQQKRAN